MGFAVASRGIHSEPVTSVQRPGVVEVRASPADALPRLVDIGADAAEAGFADLAARAWSLAAELLESGPHTDDARTRAWSQAEQALAKLPEQHPLWLRLQRDLAYIELAHARHVTAPGACTGGQSDFTSCAAIFSATRRLTRIADDAAATPTDHELLARAHEHAGDVPAAAAARTRGGPVVLDERALGYLDFGAATVVAGHMDLAASLPLRPRGHHLRGRPRLRGAAREGCRAAARRGAVHGPRPRTASFADTRCSRSAAAGCRCSAARTAT
jgi:hypothetical protein